MHCNTAVDLLKKCHSAKCERIRLYQSSLTKAPLCTNSHSSSKNSLMKPRYLLNLCLSIRFKILSQSPCKKGSTFVAIWQLKRSLLLALRWNGPLPGAGNWGPCRRGEREASDLSWPKSADQTQTIQLQLPKPVVPKYWMKVTPVHDSYSAVKIKSMVR